MKQMLTTEDWGDLASELVITSLLLPTKVRARLRAIAAQRTQETELPVSMSEVMRGMIHQALQAEEDTHVTK